MIYRGFIPIAHKKERPDELYDFGIVEKFLRHLTEPWVLLIKKRLGLIGPHHKSSPADGRTPDSVNAPHQD